MAYNSSPNQLANLKPKWEPGVQPKPGSKYVERMINSGCKLSPRAIAVVGRIMEDPLVHDEPVPLSLRLRAAELIIDKTWPKQQAGASVTIEGATSLEVNFHFPGGETKPNGHATISFDADDE